TGVSAFFARSWNIISTTVSSVWNWNAGEAFDLKNAHATFNPDTRNASQSLTSNATRTGVEQPFCPANHSRPLTNVTGTNLEQPFCPANHSRPSGVASNEGFNAKKVMDALIPEITPSDAMHRAKEVKNLRFKRL
ncbi:MAG: hypothetical protein WAM28_08335, partial [Chlamydiales bacterium]